MASFSDLRRDCSLQPGCKMVSAEEFMSLMMSHAELERADEPAANLLGLLNRHTGWKVFVRAEELATLRSTFLQMN